MLQKQTMPFILSVAYFIVARWSKTTTTTGTANHHWRHTHIHTRIRKKKKSVSHISCMLILKYTLFVNIHLQRSRTQVCCD